MKRFLSVPIASSALLCGAFPVAASDVEGLRKWTSADGRTLKASLVKIAVVDEVATATMKRESGKKFSLPLSALSEGDREAIRGWLKKNPTGVATPVPPYIWPSNFTGSATPEVVEAGYDKDGGFHVYRTRYFDFRVDEKVGKSTISQCVAVFESIVGALDSLPLALDTVPSHGGERYQAVLVSSRAKYAALGGPPNSGGFYSPSKNMTVIPFRSLGIEKKGSSWGFDGKNRSFETLVHELTHHSMGEKWMSLPVWVLEGLADYMAAMPYRSGRFLYTNVGKSATGAVRKAYKNTTWERAVMPKGEFLMIKPSTLFITSHRDWSKALARSAMDGSRYYNSSLLLVYYFMHEDGAGNGEHFIRWLHAVRAARLRGREAFGERYRNLNEEHLMRGRNERELEADIAAALKRKGLRVRFDGARR